MPSAQTLNLALSHLRKCLEIIELSDGYVDRLWVHADVLTELFARLDAVPVKPTAPAIPATLSELAALRGELREERNARLHAEARAVKAEGEAKAARLALAKERAA